MRVIFTIVAAAASFVTSCAQAETTACTAITAVPTTISVQGVYCLKNNLSTNAVSGAAITVTSNHVTIDFNGFKLGGLGGGSSSTTIGILSSNASFLSVRNGAIKGFHSGIVLAWGANNLIEDMQVDGSLSRGIAISEADTTILRRNRVTNTGTPSSQYIYGISATGTSSNRNNIITDNMVSGIYANSFGIGIAFQNARQLEISDNTITNITGESSNTLAIYAFPPLSGYPSNEMRAVIRHNMLINTGAGFGIGIEGGTAICTDNSILGFATGIISCAVSARNDVM
ncbi:right-handed parallel beta-helix repeat-containing protein [Mesorhizobium australicum]|uniref:Right handed beta helix region n=1 Tax=Mesorhizobium australicum TaxID=536018 RepID=A0A1X7PBM0_9HYPH|nr:right-handed parallel beta-helix repeat-containing protein [Mesorhizobium australicum]SMH47947.1 Right handed beta helix region [Mesorhizobium australicum]